MSDNIEVLARFRGKSEPVFLFIVVSMTFKKSLVRLDLCKRDKNHLTLLYIVFLELKGNLQKGKLTRAMFGANGIELCRIIEEELAFMEQELVTGIERPKQPIEELLPVESVRYIMPLLSTTLK